MHCRSTTRSRCACPARPDRIAGRRDRRIADLGGGRGRADCCPRGDGRPRNQTATLRESQRHCLHVVGHCASLAARIAGPPRASKSGVISFATPAWLLGLLLVPVIWYLHRSGPVLRIHPVESLDPWRDSSASANRAGERRRPDPAWIRRAAIAALLSLALAGPMLPRGPYRSRSGWTTRSAC